MFPPLNSTVQAGSVPVLITDDGHPYYALLTEAGYVRDESQARVRVPFVGLSAHELEQRKFAEARERMFVNSKADILRMLSAHDCTLGWPVVKGGK